LHKGGIPWLLILQPCFSISVSFLLDHNLVLFPVFFLLDNLMALHPDLFNIDGRLRKSQFHRFEGMMSQGSGHCPVIAKQKVVCSLLAARDLEAGHRSALGVHGTEHVIDGAILARGISTLQANQQ
jgi:hypothetical protein